jgi:hypothetical protein
VPQDLSTHAKVSISLQKASEWTQSQVIVSYGKSSSLGDVGVIVKHALCDYFMILVYSRFSLLVFVRAHLSGHPIEGYTRDADKF